MSSTSGGSLVDNGGEGGMITRLFDILTNPNKSVLL